MRRPHRTLAVLLGVALAVGVAGPAVGSHLLGADSVTGRDVRFTNGTQYDGALALGVRRWNAVGKVDLKKDTASTTADLRVIDKKAGKSLWDGKWVSSAGADEVYLNVYYLKGYSNRERQAVVAHELGHALGLGDHTSRGWKTLMYQCSTCTGFVAPQAHDRADYRKLWG